MSNSYKKNPFYEIVCIKPEEKTKIKRMMNRKHRHIENQKLKYLIEDYVETNHLKAEDSSYEYDLFKIYATKEDSYKEWYKKIIRK